MEGVHRRPAKARGRPDEIPAAAVRPAAGVVREAIFDVRQKELSLPAGIQARAVFLPGAIHRHRARAEVFIEVGPTTAAGPRGHCGAFKMAAAVGGIVRN